MGRLHFHASIGALFILFFFHKKVAEQNKRTMGMRRRINCLAHKRTLLFCMKAQEVNKFSDEKQRGGGYRLRVTDK